MTFDPRISVQAAAFDIAAEIALVREAGTGIGAIAAFVGLVREFSADASVTAMTIEHYPGMTEMELRRLALEAQARWPLLGLTIIHRVGRLLPGDDIVLVIAASAHRKAAFDAANYLMDFLKTHAPFWKTEAYPEGKRWVEAKSDDHQAASRWDA